MSKLKNKTELRKLIKSSIGNTASLDMIEFYDDGTWEIMSVSTRSGDYVNRLNLGGLSIYYGYNETSDQAITNNFLDIEMVL